MKTQTQKRKKDRAPINITGKSRFTPENRGKIIAQVETLAAPLCDAEGIELVYIEYQRESGGRVLRVYIDRAGGVTLDDCTKISRQLSDLLDVYIDSSDAYSLEVSSPGPDRPLGREKDFKRFEGNVAKIKTHQPIDGQKNFTGVLLGESEGVVKLLVNQKTVAIPFQNITKARLVNYRGDN
jgi:ribosome maturation factor RimP